MTGSLSPRQFPEIRREDLSNPDTPRSRAVSRREYQQIADRGRQMFEGMLTEGAEPKGLDRKWPDIVEEAHRAVQEPYGGLTVGARSGRVRSPNTRGYAITSRPPGAPEVSVPVGAPKEVLESAMRQARQEYDRPLRMQGAHLGVFHDADKGTIDVDPIVIVHNRRQVEELGAFTRATGGAYHFRSGQGFWPPHVEDH